MKVLDMMCNPSLTLAEIEDRLRQAGYDQDAIDSALAFVIKTREILEVELHKRDSRPS
jgi:hypothetical protein